MPLIKNRQLPFYFVLVSSLICCSYAYLTPYLSILGFKTAIEKKDYQGAEKYINFDSVRQSLKSQIVPALQQRTETKISDSPFGEIKLMLLKPILRAVVDTTIDSTVTPSGLEMLLSTGQLTQRGDNKVETLDEKNNGSKKVSVRLYYKNMNVFVLSSQIAANKETINSYWKRDSFFDWSLYAIELPVKTISSIRD